MPGTTPTPVGAAAAAGVLTIGVLTIGVLPAGVLTIGVLPAGDDGWVLHADPAFVEIFGGVARGRLSTTSWMIGSSSTTSTDATYLK